MHYCIYIAVCTHIILSGKLETQLNATLYIHVHVYCTNVVFLFFSKHSQKRAARQQAARDISDENSVKCSKHDPSSENLANHMMTRIPMDSLSDITVPRITRLDITDISS